MSKLSISTLALLSMTSMAAVAGAEAVVGQAAPPFTATDSDGRTRSLEEFKGRLIVLEWWNPECPFVGKHYGSGNMQKLQREWTGKGVVWLTIDSSAPGKQGYLTPAEAKTTVQARGAAPTAVLLDPEGKTARAYGAKTTPHMFVIDRNGTLAYAGGIDDKPSTDQEDVATAHNYVTAALEALSAGRQVATKASQPYGCSVKYAR